MTKKEVLVRKSNGELVPFDKEKLKKSLMNSGAGPAEAEEISSSIQSILYEGIPTTTIFRKGSSLLKKIHTSYSSKYRLKKAIQELGPSGFPFEKFIAELFRARGYKTRTGVNVPGTCVSHEIDIIAEKDDILIMAECKFHNLPSQKDDVKTPLYIHSRFLDIKDHGKGVSLKHDSFQEAWIITNTRFTDDAIEYAKCAGLKLLSWDYPKKNSLKELIDQSSLHPITSLTSISKSDKQHLLAQGIVLATHLKASPVVLEKLGISEKKIDSIMEEVHFLCAI